MSAKKSDGDVALLELMTPNEFRAELVRKGWTYVELGQRWDMSANWLAKVAGRADRAVRIRDGRLTELGDASHAADQRADG